MMRTTIEFKDGRTGRHDTFGLAIAPGRFVVPQDTRSQGLAAQCVQDGLARPLTQEDVVEPPPPTERKARPAAAAPGRRRRPTEDAAPVPSIAEEPQDNP